MPANVREQFALVKPLNGGPRFAIPLRGGPIAVDFSTIDLRTAEYLLRAGWPGIRRVEKKPAIPARQSKETKEAPASEKPEPDTPGSDES